MPGYTNKSLDFVRRHPGASILVTVALASGVAFTWRNDSGEQVGVVDHLGNASFSGSIVANGVNISSGAQLRYATIPLTGSGVSTATGVNVWGDLYMPYAGTFRSFGARLSEVADNNLTTVIVKKNGQSIFSTNLTVDSGENDTDDATAAAVINTASGSFVAGDIITFDVNAPATTPGRDLKLRINLLQTSFP